MKGNGSRVPVVGHDLMVRLPKDTHDYLRGLAAGLKAAGRTVGVSELAAAIVVEKVNLFIEGRDIAGILCALPYRLGTKAVA